ncbi:MAG: TRAP transporter small permease [Burkholderiales bacterium]|nr:TRAP transporter small permease [Burkholderiales bacterium]
MGPLSQADLPASTPTRAERTLSALAAVALAVLCGIVTTTIVVRAAGFALIPDDILLVQELMVAVILLPLAAVTAQRQQIAVTVFTERIGLRRKAALALLAHVVGMVFAGALFAVGVKSLLAAVASGEYFDGVLYLPTWIGWAVFSLGTGAFLLRLLLQFGIDLLHLASDRLSRQA